MKKNDILRECEQKNVRFVHLHFCDLLGMVKNVTIPISKLSRAIDEHVWFDGSSIEGFTRIFESDMYLQLDLSTFSLVPWESSAEDSVARIICDVYLPDGTPFFGDPRQILRRQIKRAKKMGYEYFVGPELEFFLFPRDEKGRPIPEPHDRTGYFDYAGDRATTVRRAMSDAVQQMGVDVETIHHEVAPGQHEIDFKYVDALQQADQVLTVKSVLKAVAQKHNLHATFMPKPLSGANGSGMHVHQSLWKNEKNSFYAEKGEYGNLSKVATSFIAGQLKYVPEMVAVTNPTINSYKRLIPGYEAPIYVAWGQKNRSALIRIPHITPGDTSGIRCEIRCPDSSSNPYLAFAVMLAAGLNGVEQNMTPPNPIDEDIYAFTDKKAKRMRVKMIPETLQKAMQNLVRGTLVKEVFGKELYEKFIQAKQIEITQYHQQISQWEMDRYLENY